MNPIKRKFSWADVEMACMAIQCKLVEDKFKPDYIVGLTRGGLIPAVILSHKLKTKLVALDVSFRDSIDGPDHNLWLPEEITNNDKKVLIVDDINDSGKTFTWIKNDWTDAVFKPLKWGNVRFVALVHNKSSETYTDYSFLTIDKNVKDEWIVYPWEQQ